MSLDHTLIMGILNVTDDSFYAGSRVYGEAVLSRACEMLDAGADILDIGAESTRPGSRGVDDNIESAHLVAAIDAIREKFPDAVISADTKKPRVAECALAHGADILNDISGGSDGDNMRIAAEHGALYVLMHMRGTPATMQQHAHYGDVVGEIASYFEERVALAERCGLAREKIILDPGIGFAKELEHNLAILANLSRFRELGLPILVGASRKGMIGKVLNLSDPADRLEGTLAITALAAWQGAEIVRVHDARENLRAARMADAIRGAAR